MFTDLFNCVSCNKPYDCKSGEPRTPGYVEMHNRTWCRTCYGDTHVVVRGLMDFLDQPEFEKTDKAYDYTLPIKNPPCIGCQEEIKVILGLGAFIAKCGHYLCHGCNNKRLDGKCFTCATCAIGSGPTIRCQMDNVLLSFAHFLKGHQVAQDTIDAIAAMKEEDRRSGAVRDCSGCGIERPVERLYKCDDCKTINCGDCCFDSHQGHAVVKLLGTVLVEMEQKHENKYTETLTGLHGNLKHVQMTIDEAVEKVLAAGKDRLAQITKQVIHDDAQRIVMTVEKAAEDFEKHCEEYIPVGRKLATRLTELSEELMKS